MTASNRSVGNSFVKRRNTKIDLLITWNKVESKFATFICQCQPSVGGNASMPASADCGYNLIFCNKQIVKKTPRFIMGLSASIWQSLVIAFAYHFL